VDGVENREAGALAARKWCTIPYCMKASSSAGQDAMEAVGKLLEYLGFAAPLLYGAAVYGFFGWLDENLSDAAKAALATFRRKIRVARVEVIWNVCWKDDTPPAIPAGCVVKSFVMCGVSSLPISR
jgi:hypothetical protein